jgi:hypothetical protein
MIGRVLVKCALVAACSASHGSFEATSGVVDVLIYAGQSNMVGADSSSTPAWLPFAPIPEWFSDLFYDDGLHRWDPLHVSPHGAVFSHEVQTAKRLYDAGYQVAVIKMAQGATFSNRWVPSWPGGPAQEFYTELAEAVASLTTQFPNATGFRFHFTWDQGEEEARYGYPSPNTAETAVIMAWDDNVNAIRAQVETIVGIDVDFQVVRTCSTIDHKVLPGVLEQLQLNVVDDPADLHDTNDLVFRSDNVHRIGASQLTLGDRIADRILAKLAANQVPVLAA